MKKALGVAQVQMEVDTVIKRHVAAVEKADRQLMKDIQAQVLHRKKTRFNGKVGFIEYFRKLIQ